MSAIAVLVNGLPGSGKTTLCRAIGPALGMPTVAKDAVKEALADAVDAPLPTRWLGAVSSDVMWAMAGRIPGPVIIESFWMTGRDDEHLRRGLDAAGVRNGVELWCEAPVDLMRSRFRARPRHVAHRDADRHEEWEGFGAAARPLSGFPVIHVDTGGPVDVGALAGEVRRILDSGPAA